MPEMFEAIEAGDLAAIREWFADASNDPDASIDADASGWTGLRLATATNGPRLDEIIKIYLANGANPNAADGQGVTPLHEAARNRKYSAATLLIDAGADVNARTNNGWTPIMAPTSRGFVNMMRLLMRRGAAIDVRDNDGEDLISWARASGIDGGSRPPAVALLADVKAAGTWARYMRSPRVGLLLLRVLCEKGRARAPADDLLEPLFAPRPARSDGRRRTRASKRADRIARLALPREVFWHIASFWRSARDDDDDAALRYDDEAETIAPYYTAHLTPEFQEFLSVLPPGTQQPLIGLSQTQQALLLDAAHAPDGAGLSAALLANIFGGGDGGD